MAKLALILLSALLLLGAVSGADNVQGRSVSRRKLNDDQTASASKSSKKAKTHPDSEETKHDDSHDSHDYKSKYPKSPKTKHSKSYSGYYYEGLDDVELTMSMQYQEGKGGSKGPKKDKKSAKKTKGKQKVGKKHKTGYDYDYGYYYDDKYEKKEKSSKDKKGYDTYEKGSKSSKSPKEKGDEEKRPEKEKKGKTGKEGKAKKGSKQKYDGPTPPPFSLEDITPSPTSSNSIPIRVSPYSLLYSIRNAEVPSTAEFREVGEVTRVYLESFMIKEFGQTSLTNLDDFVTIVVKNTFTAGNPIQVEFRSTGLFNPSSIFLPTVRELDGLIREAFTGDSLDSYLRMVRSLPNSNQFSNANNVELTTPIAAPRSRVYQSTKTDAATASIGAVAAGIVVLAAGLAIRRGKQNATDDDDDGSLDGKCTSDETTTMSLCTSDVASTWRQRSADVINFKNETRKGHNDEDEDDDDEDSIGDDSMFAAPGPPNECFLPSQQEANIPKSTLHAS